MRRQYKLALAFTLVIILTCSSIVLSGYWKDNNSVNSIVMKGNVSLTKDEIFSFAKLTDSLIKNNDLSLEIIESRIAKHPNIKKINVTRRSSVITIEIWEKDPFAVVVNKSKMFFLDNELNIFPIKKEKNEIDVPVLSGFSDSLDLNRVTADDYTKFKTSKYIISRATKIDKLMSNSISEINFSDPACLNIYLIEGATLVNLVDYSSVRIYDGSLVSLSAPDVMNSNFRREINLKIYTLYNFLKQVLLYRGSNSYERIDMRYDNMLVAKNRISQTN